MQRRGVVMQRRGCGNAEGVWQCRGGAWLVGGVDEVAWLTRMNTRKNWGEG